MKKKKYDSPEFDFVLVKMLDRICDSKTEDYKIDGDWGYGFAPDAEE